MENGNRGYDVREDLTAELRNLLETYLALQANPNAEYKEYRRIEARISEICNMLDRNEKVGG